MVAAGQTAGALNVTFAGNDTPYLDASSISATITGTSGGGNLIITTDPAPAVTQINDTIDTTTVTLTRERVGRMRAARSSTPRP